MVGAFIKEACFIETVYVEQGIMVAYHHSLLTLFILAQFK